MRKRWIETNLVGIVASVLTGAVVLWVLELPTKFVFALILGIVTFSLYHYLMGEDFRITVRITVPFSLTINKNHVFIFVHAISIATVALVPPIETAFFTNWVDIPFVNWIRFLSALLLTTFIPGYVILRFINQRNDFNKIEVCLFSFLLSLFFVPLINYIGLLLGWYSEWVLLGFNFALLLAFCVFSLNSSLKRIQEKFTSDPSIEKQSFYTAIILICTVAFLLVMWCAISVTWPTMQTGDNWRLHGSAIEFQKGFFPSEPWFFIAYLASVFTLSGLPSINSYNLLSFLNVMPLIALFLLTSVFFGRKNPKVSVIAVSVFAFFQGFSWLYVVPEKMTTKVTDIHAWYHILFETWIHTCLGWNNIFSFFAYLVPQMVGMTTIFMLIYLVRRDKLHTSCYILTTILVAQALLMHIVDLLFYLVALPLFIWFFREESFSRERLRKISLCSLLGLFIVFIVDFCAPLRIYFTEKFSFFLLSCVSLILVTFFLTYIKVIFTLTNKELLRNHACKIGLTIIIFIGYLYGLSLIIWDKVGRNYDIYYNYSLGLIPWYFYPMMIGVSGFLVLISAVYLVFQWRERKRTLGFFLILLLAYLVIGRCNSLINTWYYPWFFTGFREKRIFFFLIPIVSIIAAFAAVQLSSKVERKRLRVLARLIHSPPHGCTHQPTTPIKRVETKRLSVYTKAKRLKFIKPFAVGSLALVLVSSTLPSLFTTEFYIAQYQMNPVSESTVSTEEREALNYLRLSLTPESGVVTVTDESKARVQAFTGSRRILESTYELFEATNLEFVYYILGVNNYKYIYLASRDLQRLYQYHSEGFFARFLIRNMPVIFKKPEVTIYNFTISPPSISNFSITTNTGFNRTGQASANNQSTWMRTYFYPVTMVALANLQYTVSLETDNNLFSSSTIMYAYDPKDLELVEYLRWAANGGRLIVLNSLGYGTFADFLSVIVNESHFANGIQREYEIISIPTITVPTIYSLDKNTEVISHYTENGIPVSVFAFRRTIGNGEIIYLNVGPYFSAIQEAGEDDNKRTMFSHLGHLIKVLDLRLPKYISPRGPTRFDKALDKIYVSGQVEIKPTSFLIHKQANQLISYLNLSLAETCIINRKDVSESDPLRTSLSKVVIQDFKIQGSTKSTITTAQARVLPSDSGTYSLIRFDDSLDWEINLSEDTYIILNATVGNSTYDVTIRGGSIKLTVESDDIVALAKDPTFGIQGQMNCQSILVGQIAIAYQSYIGRTRQTPPSLTINGRSSFRIVASTTSSMLLLELTSDGTIEVPYEPLIWNEFNIPWPEILLCPYHFILVGVIGLVLYNYHSYRRRQRKVTRQRRP